MLNKERVGILLEIVKKTTYKDCIPETKQFKFLCLNMIDSNEIKDDLKDLEELADIQSKV